jgi:hypothetical protein
LPQSVLPSAHADAQLPALQQPSAPHALPQAPQFALSFCRSTHWPLQKT